MKKVNYDSLPSSFESVGNGSYLYRWDIEQRVNPDPAAQNSWECYEVTLCGLPTENAITQATFAALWGDGVEQKLLNDFQAAQAGILDSAFATPYTDFLATRKALKEKIADDFALWKSAM
ncbi:MAG: hypothetical protein SNG49_05730 [Rikenellaceae bacterium]